MSLRTTLLPSLLHLHPAAPPKAAKRLFHWLPNQPGTIIHPSPRSIPTQPIAITRSKTAQPRQSRVPIYTTLGLALGLTAYSAFTKPKIACAAYAGYPNDLTNTPPQPAVTGGESLPNESILSVYQLGFGTVAGICTGVFLKKGLRAIAFLLGGVFVFLQYMNSKQFIKVDWSRLSSRYDGAFGTKAVDGHVQPPTVTGAWNMFVDFVTANFQQRASFLAGMVLGFRLG